MIMNSAIEKVSIIVSKGSLEGIYPALIMANGARAEGIEANLFFTFFGLDAITKKRHEHIKVATVGNPGLHLATIVGALPGMPGLMTSYLGHKMAKLDIPPIPEFIEMIADSGAGLYGCQASCDLFGISKDDLIEQVQGIITVGDLRYGGRRPDHLHLTSGWSRVRRPRTVSSARSAGTGRRWRWRGCRRCGGSARPGAGTASGRRGSRRRYRRCPARCR